jgi:hypothetical protein
MLRIPIAGLAINVAAAAGGGTSSPTFDRLRQFLFAHLSKVALLRISVTFGLLAGFWLSPKLWLSSRLYPLTPVWSFVRPFGSPADRIVFFALIALLIAASVAPRREILIAVFALLMVLAVQDQSRWQPWFYQYVIMLLAIALAGTERQAGALNTCCLIVAATYIWSGLAKLNPNFVGDTFPWLVEPFIGAAPAPVQWLARHMGWVAPFFECCAGVGLLTRRFRRPALFCAIAIHVFILIAIGPLGQRFNIVVWPWNLAMIAFLLILFVRRTGEPALRDIIWGRAFAFQKLALILFALLPPLSFFNLWDHYLSSALYSGNRTSGIVYLSDDAFAWLPEEIQDYVYEDGPDHNWLNINDWSLGELNVPSYPEARIYKSVAKEICDYALNGRGVQLVVQGKLALGNHNRRSIYPCSGL